MRIGGNSLLSKKIGLLATREPLSLSVLFLSWVSALEAIEITGPTNPLPPPDWFWPLALTSLQELKPSPRDIYAKDYLF